MGKSHEAMLIVAQRWMEGHGRILLCIPNIDLLSQWTELLDRCYNGALCGSDQPSGVGSEHFTGFTQRGLNRMELSLLLMIMPLTMKNRRHLSPGI